jgi:hypothetical protein
MLARPQHLTRPDRMQKRSTLQHADALDGVEIFPDHSEVDPQSFLLAEH